MIDFSDKIIIFKFFKFGIVGFSGLFVDFGITYLCKEKLRIEKFISNSIGFCCAATSNYFLNRIWTFRSTNPQVMIEFSEFFLISLIGLGINLLILWILTTKFSKNFYLSKLFAVGVVTLWNFCANMLITFNY